MKIGINTAGIGPEATIDGLIAQAKRVEQMGFDSLWIANMFGLEAIMAMALIGRETSRIKLGTAVVPTYPRHPMVMAQMAATAQAASKGRFILGIGLSHKPVIEGALGMSFDKPARHMREYLQVLGPLLRNEKVQFAGELYKTNGQISVAESQGVPLVVAALGDVMLKIAGTLADGTITWMVGPKTLENHIIPKITKAAKEAPKPAPRIVAGMPFALVPDKEAVRDRLERGLKMYGTLASYRAMLDKEGLKGPADLACAGGEKELRASIQRLRDIGVTDLNCTLLGVGDRDATLQFLQSELKQTA
ncbi:MAG TPA: LLM class F420-dependent oxidoreductase [Alphaproteobacteria bacterium]|nr:LLM class F420-dependent oxidoreductase [Alphaproteobacteria bacterium]